MLVPIHMENLFKIYMTILIALVKNSTVDPIHMTILIALAKMSTHSKSINIGVHYFKKKYVKLQKI